MRQHWEPASWVWKVPVAGFAYGVGAMFGGGLVSALGQELPAIGPATSLTLQMVLLFAGGVAMAMGLSAMAVGVSGRWWQRWGLLAAFVFVVFGVGNALEASIFTNIPGQWTLMWINVAAGGLCALAVSLLFAGPSEGGLADQLRAFLAPWSAGGLAWRLAIAFLAFPFYYFLFGMIVAPIVTPHYARLDFLTIPPMATIFQVLFVRSALFLLVSLAIIAAWGRSRVALAVGLGLGHFAAVGFAGLIQATMLPAVLRWAHGIEILADSMFYAWTLAWLFMPRPQRAKHPEPKVPRSKERFA